MFTERGRIGEKSESKEGAEKTGKVTEEKIKIETEETEKVQEINMQTKQIVANTLVGIGILIFLIVPFVYFSVCGSNPFDDCRIKENWYRAIFGLVGCVFLFGGLALRWETKKANNTVTLQDKYTIITIMIAFVLYLSTYIIVECKPVDELQVHNYARIYCSIFLCILCLQFTI